MVKVKLKKKKQPQRRRKLKRKKMLGPYPADIQFARSVFAPTAKVITHRCLGGEIPWVFMWKIRCHHCGFYFTADKEDNPEITWEELLEKRKNARPKKLDGLSGKIKRHCDDLVRRGINPDLQIAEGSLGKVFVCSDGTRFGKD